MPTEIHCADKTVRDINREIKAAIAQGETKIRVLEPGARHNLGVALTDAVEVEFDGSVGYYCGGLIDAAHLKIKGSAGWGVGESKLGGRLSSKAARAMALALRCAAARWLLRVMPARARRCFIQRRHARHRW